MTLHKTLLMLFAYFALIISPLVANAKSPPTKPSYNAKTAEECILEKQCAWYAFGLQLGIFDYVQWVKVGKALRKWEHDLPVGVKGNGYSFLPTLADVSKQLDIYFPFEMRVDSYNPRYLITITDDVDSTFDTWEKRLDESMGQGRSRLLFNKMKTDKMGCLSFHGQNKLTQDISSVFTIIDTNHPHAEYCMAVNFYDALGLYGYLETQPFSFLSDKNKKDIKFTDLDLFLLFLLYQPEFKSGMRATEIHDIYMKIYDRAKKDFLDIKKNYP